MNISHIRRLRHSCMHLLPMAAAACAALGAGTPSWAAKIDVGDPAWEIRLDTSLRQRVFT